MAHNRDIAAEQMSQYKANQRTAEVLTTGTGRRVDDLTNTMTMGPRGPVALEDHVYLEHLARFDRERIPERVVHAKGSGAFGYFEVTHDISEYCRAAVFSQIGKRTPVALRFSTVGGESGSADTARDPRGFAVKFYTEDGNWDLVGNNTPIFFIRDPILFPSFIHTQKRNPVTNLKDVDMFWDFISLRPESCHQVAFLFGDRGTPDGYRRMNGYGSHTFKMVNSQNEAIYCKFHFKTNQGIKNLLAEEADRLAGEDPDHAQRDLYNSIAGGDHPSWSVKLQVMTFQQATACSFNPFDVTKVWPHADYPLIDVGQMVLNKNPTNYFAEVEQLAFCPSHVVDGIQPSPDKMLQGRLFSYMDTHLHRLGPNYLQLPVNCPYRTKVNHYQRSGPACFNGNQGAAPNYFPNSFNGPQPDPAATWYPTNCPSADVRRYDTGDDDNFSQVGTFWSKTLPPDARTRLVENMGKHLSGAQPSIQARVVSNYTKCHPEFGSRLQDVLRKYSSGQPAV